MPSEEASEYNGIGFAGLELTAGKKYEFKSKKIQYAEPFTKTKFTYDESTNTIGTREHQMSFKGMTTLWSLLMTVVGLCDLGITPPYIPTLMSVRYGITSSDQTFLP